MSIVDELKKMFEKGLFEKALLGGDDFYIRDYTWGEHDSLLVFYHLFAWLKANENPLNKIKLKEIFADQFRRNKTVSEIDQGLESIHLIRSYCIEADDQNYWPIEQEFFIELITENISQFTKEEIESLNIKRDIYLLRDYLPGLSSALF